MTAWIIEPREPLIVRDGRPFDPQPGVMAATLPFPFPSTTAGAARSQAGLKDGVFTVQGDELKKLLELRVKGPLLAMADDQEENWQVLVPAPADALLLPVSKDDQDNLRRKALVPLNRRADEFASPLRNDPQAKLAPVGPTHYEADKPAGNQPAFWCWKAFAEWLLRSEEEVNKPTGTTISISELGIKPLPQQQRVHVSLEPKRLVAREGALFETRSLEFSTEPAKTRQPRMQQARRLALWLDVQEEHRYQIEDSFGSLGGERRLVRWRKITEPSITTFEGVRNQVIERLQNDRACRLILLTPAYFKQGYLPAGQSWEGAGIRPTLKAAIVQRPQVVSGWDLARGQARPTRRLAPAGSVFFLSFPENTDRQALKAWAEAHWMECISDEEQDCRDGFGLAVLGTWDGDLKDMQI